MTSRSPTAAPSSRSAPAPDCSPTRSSGTTSCSGRPSGPTWSSTSAVRRARASCSPRSPRTDGSTTGIGSRVAALMQFRVGRTTHPHARIPYRLGHVKAIHAPNRVAMTWTFGVGKDRHGSFWSINGKRFDPRRVDHKVALGSGSAGGCATPATPPTTSTCTRSCGGPSSATASAPRRGSAATRTPGGSTRARRGGRRALHRLHRRLHDPLPHARPRGRRHDGDVAGRPETLTRGSRPSSRGRRRARPPCASGAAASRAGCGRGSSRCSR